MNQLFYLIALLFITISGYCQINPADSTVQVIAYWDKDEKQTYDVVYEKLKVQTGDTVVTQHITYKVDITVTDSTATSYTVEWKYRDFTSKENNIAAKVAGLTNGLTVRFKTNEIGEYQELLNWDEINAHQKNAIKTLVKDNKLPKYYTNLLNIRNTRETAEESLLKDIMQFYAFHGHAMALGEEVTDTVEDKNELGYMMKSDIYMVLEEIDFENDGYLIKFYQTYDDASVANAMSGIIGEFLGDDLKGSVKATDLEDYYGAYIHDTGWPVSVYFERSMLINNVYGIETRAIELE